MAGRSLDLTGIQKAAILFIIVGPERASKVFKFLKEDEVEQLRALGAVSASLGKRILRTETAGMAGISMVMYEFDELE